MSTRGFGGLLRSVASSRLLWPVRAAAFWAAVFLPFCSVALVAVGSVTDVTRLVSLLAANVVAFVVGHDHGR